MTTQQKSLAIGGAVLAAAVAIGVIVARAKAPHPAQPAPKPPAQIETRKPVTPAAPPQAAPGTANGPTAPAPSRDAVAKSGCTPPAEGPPAAPDGGTATEAEMKQGHDRVQAYVNTLEAYQGCLNHAADDPGLMLTQAQRQQLIEAGNGAVDEANLLARAFAVQIAAFHAAHPGEAPGEPKRP